MNMPRTTTFKRLPKPACFPLSLKSCLVSALVTHVRDSSDNMAAVVVDLVNQNTELSSHL